MHAHILGLYTAIYHVEDLSVARDWYAAMLGVQPYFDQPFYVGFNLAGHELGLLPATSQPRQSKGVVAYWGVRDIEAAEATLAAQGLALYEAITEVGGGIRVASFLDSDGNVVGLIENPHFGTDSTH